MRLLRSDGDERKHRQRDNTSVRDRYVLDSIYSSVLKIFIRLFVLGGTRLAVNDLDVSGQYVRRMEMALVWLLVTLGSLL